MRVGKLFQLILGSRRKPRATSVMYPHGRHTDHVLFRAKCVFQVGLPVPTDIPQGFPCIDISCGGLTPSVEIHSGAASYVEPINTVYLGDSFDHTKSLSSRPDHRPIVAMSLRRSPKRPVILHRGQSLYWD